MSISVQYTALARLLTHSNRVHDLNDIMREMPLPNDYPQQDDVEYEDLPLNPFAELQDEIDREVRASLVTCWLALPEPEDY